MNCKWSTFQKMSCDWGRLGLVYEVENSRAHSIEGKNSKRLTLSFWLLFRRSHIAQLRKFTGRNLFQEKTSQMKQIKLSLKTFFLPLVLIIRREVNQCVGFSGLHTDMLNTAYLIIFFYYSLGKLINSYFMIVRKSIQDRWVHMNHDAD